MKQLLVLLAVLCAAHAAKKDLSEKVFTFPAASSTSSVRLVPDSEDPLNAFTMCMRFFSSHAGSQSLFSLALPSSPDALLLLKPSIGVYRLHIGGAPSDIKGLPDEQDEWNSVCWTWSSNTGLTTLWVNGKRSARQVLGANVSLTGRPSIILGQGQERNGGFHPSRPFVGDITDVHLWNSVLPPCEIRSFIDGGLFTSGNRLNWKNLQYSTTSAVFEETSDFDKMCDV